MPMPPVTPDPEPAPPSQPDPAPGGPLEAPPTFPGLPPEVPGQKTPNGPPEPIVA